MRNRLGHWLSAFAVGLLMPACGGRTLGGELAQDASASTGGDGSNGGEVPDGAEADGAPDGVDAAEAPDSPAPRADSGPAPSHCNPTTCQGCCQPDGTCVSGTQTNGCGIHGQACSVCAPGDFCRGACVHWQSNCGPSNCAGCCLGDLLCSSGLEYEQCGRGGQLCQPCGSGQCVPQSGGGGLCNGVATCDKSNCQGCCDGNLCQVGLDDAKCGSGGDACQPCAAGSQCDLHAGNGGTCEPVATCGPQSCMGCCSGNVCVYGNQDIACGTGGAACADCTASGKTCTSGSCG